MEEDMVAKSPLKWPTTTPRARSRRDANFSTRDSGARRSLNIQQALNRLYEELRRIGVKDIDADLVIWTNLKVSAVSGTILDQGQPTDPGVVVHWEAKGKQRTMAIDIYNRVADNIAAVAEVLKYLRGVERHGGSVIQEQAFAGFDALPPPDSCWKILGLDENKIKSATVADGRQLVLEAFRTLAMDGHQDKGGIMDMGKLTRARDDALAEVRGAV
jgi:hypothetical protein